MKFDEACQRCHVRSAIYLRSHRESGRVWVRYWKNHPVPLRLQVPEEYQSRDDWEEFDPREEPQCSEFEETPA